MSNDEIEKSKAPLDQYKDVELPAIHVAPDGGAVIPVGQPAAVPAATPENFLCLRGPCRHYWHLETFMASGNPKGTWGPGGLKGEDGKPIRVPRQINRTCLAHPGTETELTEDCVYECNRWDPLTPGEVSDKAKKAEKYYRINPTHRPKED